MPSAFCLCLVLVGVWQGENYPMPLSEIPASLVVYTESVADEPHAQVGVGPDCTMRCSTPSWKPEAQPNWKAVGMQKEQTSDI